MNDLDWQGEVFCLRFFQNPLDGVIYVNIVTTCQEEDNYYFFVYQTSQRWFWMWEGAKKLLLLCLYRDNGETRVRSKGRLTLDDTKVKKCFSLDTSYLQNLMYLEFFTWNLWWNDGPWSLVFGWIRDFQGWNGPFIGPTPILKMTWLVF